jgi:ERCC4-type nuclease
MIYVDRREGSIDLDPLIVSPHIVVTLDYGDVMFDGEGGEGVALIGVERKRITDLINSIASGRLVGHQLPGMFRTYDVSYLFVEGIMKGDRMTGELLHSKDGGKSFRTVSFGKKTWTEKGVCNFLTTLETKTPLHIRLTRDARATARMIEYLAGWWGEKWEKHSSHLALHKGMNFRSSPQRVSLMPTEKPSLVRMIAAELPGVGVGRSLPVGEKFRSVREMFDASEKDWQSIPGFGKVTSKMAWEALHK